MAISYTIAKDNGIKLSLFPTEFGKMCASSEGTLSLLSVELKLATSVSKARFVSKHFLPSRLKACWNLSKEENQHNAWTN
jgi:hypothetical protein